MKKILLLGLLTLTACADLPGPSVPTQAGQNLASARQAVDTCAPNAPRGGQNAVVGSYVGGVLLGGILIGPIIVASNESRIRANGEANAVDRCLNKLGFERRDLTAGEVRALNSRTRYQRHLLLDHLIGGGSLQSFGSLSVQG